MLGYKLSAIGGAPGFDWSLNQPCIDFVICGEEGVTRVTIGDTSLSGLHLQMPGKDEASPEDGRGWQSGSSETGGRANPGGLGDFDLGMGDFDLHVGHPGGWAVLGGSTWH